MTITIIISPQCHDISILSECDAITEEEKKDLEVRKTVRECDPISKLFRFLMWLFRMAAKAINDDAHTLHTHTHPLKPLAFYKSDGS